MDSPEKLGIIESVDADAGRTDIWTAERAARETGRLLNLIPEGLSSDQEKPLRQFAIKIGENLVDEIEFDFELQRRAGDSSDQAYDLACQCRERIVDLSPNSQVADKRAYVLPQFIGTLTERYSDALMDNKDYTVSREERTQQIDAIIYFGIGFNDALTGNGLTPESRAQHAEILRNDNDAFANYYTGYFVAKVGTGDPKGFQAMEAVNDRLSYRNPKFSHRLTSLHVLGGVGARIPSFLSDREGYLPFVAWAACLEEKEGLETDTKERFDDAMAHYGYVWDSQNNRYRWLY